MGQATSVLEKQIESFTPDDKFFGFVNVLMYFKVRKTTYVISTQ